MRTSTDASREQYYRRDPRTQPVARTLGRGTVSNPVEATPGRMDELEVRLAADADAEPVDAGTASAEATADAPTPPPDAPPADEPDVNAADLMGDGQRTEAADGDETADDAGAEPDGALADEESERDLHRTTVRVTRDVGEILGIDERVYRLEADDVVTLPEENAQPLLQREAAERLE